MRAFEYNNKDATYRTVHAKLFQELANMVKTPSTTLALSTYLKPSSKLPQISQLPQILCYGTKYWSVEHFEQLIMSAMVVLLLQSFNVTP